MRAIHICTFTAKRVMPTAEPPITASRYPGGPPETFTPKPVRMGRCDAESDRGRCTRRAVGWASYVWGSTALCSKHLDEECGPDAAEGSAP